MNENEREKDIILLCEKVLEASPATYYNPNGPNDTTCPFCSCRVHYEEAEMKDMPHTQNCAYLIAKDLLTGIKP